jgi:hypothetical protein
MLGKAADHAHPLRRRRDRHLALEHVHRIGERAHAIPAQLHVEVEPATDDVEMIVDQSRKHALAFEVDHLCRRPRELHDLLIVSDGGEHAVLDRHRAGGGIAPVERREQAAVKNEIWRR